MTDSLNQGRDDEFMDIDRMVNEGLAGGIVTSQNGLIESTTTDSMEQQESILEQINRSHVVPHEDLS